MSFSSASPAVSSPPSQLAHPPPMLSASRSPTGAMAQSSATPASPSPPALISQSPRVAPHLSDSLGPRTMRTLALGAVTTVGLAALAPLTVAGTRIAGDGVFNLTLAVAAVRHAAVSVHEQSRGVKHNKKLAFQVGDKAVALVNALVAAEGLMPLSDVISNAERIMRLFGCAREEFHRTETASRVRLPHGKKNAGELQKILDEAETILRQLKPPGSSNPTSSKLVSQVQPVNPLPVDATVLDGIELVLETTMNASDNFLPPLKTAAQTALQLLRRFKAKAQSYRSNVTEIEIVMQLVVDMLERIRADTVRHAAASETLIEFAQRLLSVVEGTLYEVQRLEAASGVEHILSVPTVSAVLAGTHVKINDGIRDYQTSVATWTAGAVHCIDRNVEMLVSSQPPAVPASLITRIPPPLPHVFHGREAEIALARDQILNHQPARIPILGAGGIGKTSLALAILHNADIKAHFADQRLFLACDSAPDTDAIVNYLLRMLQIEVSGRDPWDALLTTLDSTTTLLVLDNFETVYTGNHRQKADLLLQRLAACSCLTLILTMRGASLPKSITWSLSLVESSLQPLSPDSAQSTFIDLVDRELSAPEHSAMVTLLARVDHMPLAIVLLAHLAADGLSPVDLLPRWDKERAQLISGDPEQGRLYSIQASVQLSIDSIPKSAVEALPLLSVCSYLADGLYAGTQASLAAVFDQPISCSADVLRRLALVYVGQYGELRMLSPIRHHVCQYYPVDPRYMDCLRSRYFHLAVESDQPMDEHFPALNARVSMEVQNLTVFLEEEIQQRPNSDTAEAVVAFSWFLYWTIPSPALATALLPHVKSSGDSLKLMDVLVSLLRSTHQYTDAMQMATQMRARAADAQDTRSIANATQHLGGIERMLSDYPTARSHLQEAQNLFEGIGDCLGQAQCMQSLGEIEYMLDNYPTARSCVQEAQKLFERIGARLGQAQCMKALGNIEHALSNYPAARGHLQEAKNLFEGMGVRLGQAQCMRSLGDIECMLDNHPAARRYLQEAQNLFEAIGSRLGQAQCMRSLGNIEYMLHNYPTARSCLQGAQNLFEVMGDRLGQAQCMQSLGNIERMLDNYPTARGCLQDAQKLCEVIGDRLGQAQCMQSLGDIEHKLNNYPSARSLFQEAQILSEETSDRSGQAYCMYLLGHLEKDLNDYKQALQYFTDARTIFLAIEGHARFVDDCDENIEELHELMQTDK
ncbi:TPR-like protein [Exidia glandulosa HHB12029]|uniref:TPR-like protein n=1 Tax=Exidia glandulosa HHB12029 TaxID=1314781 RepID=A0A165K3I6_EXIGL|nr:TPR-like protein [Exidia glandulosa HHB12029]